ncbi:MAG: LysR family transcriptional regulator [Anaerolineae bacterium]|jgi:DNA-binding transcriptional LysR family regulator|nr:LysR family transcriptional regulator [Anaerolineae bacterium]MBT7071052.1 LysR family transcriptional regulator [Anaerolineae bacterium]MBT7323758.1 LysR family transcriptional regulator [Anaerolineae bacterium]
MLNLTEIKVFVTAAEEMNFSRAAQRLHLSQSAVSQNIQSLEKDYDVKLFNRRGRSVFLSEAGQTLLPMARELLDTSRLFEDTLHNINGHTCGMIEIGCSTTSGKYLLPKLVASFRHLYPDVRANINVMGRKGVINRVVQEKFCIGILSKQIDHSLLEYQPFYEDRVILIVHPDHPWGEYGKALPSDLVDQPLILREETSGTREVMLDGLKTHGITADRLNVVMEVGNAEAIEIAVEEGIGIAFISELAAARALTLGRVRKVMVEGLNLQRTLYAMRHISTPCTRAQTLFWDFVQSQREHLNDAVFDNLTNVSTI